MSCGSGAPQGSRAGRILLVAAHEIQDPEHTGRYTLKVYESEKVGAGDSWKHTRIPGLAGGSVKA